MFCLVRDTYSPVHVTTLPLNVIAIAKQKQTGKNHLKRNNRQSP